MENTDDFTLTAEFTDYLPDAPAETPEDSFNFTPDETVVADTVEVVDAEFVGTLEEVGTCVEAPLDGRLTIEEIVETGTWNVAYYEEDRREVAIWHAIHDYTDDWAMA